MPFKSGGPIRPDKLEYREDSNLSSNGVSVNPDCTVSALLVDFNQTNFDIVTGNIFLVKHISSIGGSWCEPQRDSLFIRVR
jgi:hypothetical protein